MQNPNVSIVMSKEKKTKTWKRVYVE